MTVRQKYAGPYRAKDIGAVGETWEVVEMADNHSNTWYELRPRKMYGGKNARQAAYMQMARMNKRWQEQLNPDEQELLEYWQNATN